MHMQTHMLVRAHTRTHTHTHAWIGSSAHTVPINSTHMCACMSQIESVQLPQSLRIKGMDRDEIISKAITNVYRCDLDGGPPSSLLPPPHLQALKCMVVSIFRQCVWVDSFHTIFGAVLSDTLTERQRERARAAYCIKVVMRWHWMND